MTGRRPGTEAPLAAVLAAALFPTFATWLYFVVLPGSRWMMPVYAGCKVLQFAFPLLWIKLRRLGGGSSPLGGGGLEQGGGQEGGGFSLPENVRGHWGHPPPSLPPVPTTPSQGGGTHRPEVSKLKSLLGGLLSGMGIAAFLFLVWETLLAGGPVAARAARTVSVKLAGFGIETAAGFLLLAVFYAVLHSLLEEYYWRWFVFGQLRRSLPVTTAAILSSLAFMSHHVLVVGEFAGAYNARTWILASTVGCGGLLWAWLYHRSRSLYGPWLSHALADAALLWIGYGLWRP